MEDIIAILITGCVGIIGAVTGAFLGFYLTTRASDAKSKIDVKQYKDSIAAELQKIVGEIRYTIESETAGAFAMYEMPIWDSAVSSGRFLNELMKDDVLKKYAEVYSYVKLLSVAETELIKANMSTEEFANAFVGVCRQRVIDVFGEIENIK
ncbi:MAG: hypothetical protein LBB30_02980 [Candidatus Methanoplasma sp.]|nr:hypothetical protein [Candidatus Methanoplasma sp.]